MKDSKFIEFFFLQAKEKHKNFSIFQTSYYHLWLDVDVH